MPTYLPFDPNPRRPSKLPPPKSIDSQFHVLGPLEKYPVRPGAAYQMPSATWEAALRVHKTLGIERGIIVQTTTYGADHAVVLDALAAMGPNYRACANALVFAEASGGTTDDIIKMTVWLQDRTQRAPVNVEWLKMFPDEHSRPARHALQMDMENGALVQCDFTAVIG